ncbi:hypothetical protein QL285_067199 [Trifolium repens]|nr:hypothetical protein QL285_067199 [Trifolium repens]
MVDLEEGLPRPGLGPQDVELLGIEKEDIGLKLPVLILDYPSPKDLGVKYGGANLSREDILKVRENILNSNHGLWDKIRKVSGVEGVINGIGLKKAEENNNYFVEYPPEEENIVSTVCTLGNEEVLTLSTNLHSKLNIKRFWKEILPTHDEEEEVNEVDGNKRFKRGDDLVGSSGVSKHFLSMAEEAGLSMPPTSK